jgi:hypothetical protein
MREFEQHREWECFTYSFPSATATLPMYSDPIVIAAVTALVEAPEMEAAERKDVEGGGGGY